MDMSGLTPIMYMLAGVVIVVMIVKMIMESIGKRKKPKIVEIPRDTVERLNKAYKTAIRSKLNKDRMRHVLLVSGDELIQGYRVGDIIAVQPLNEEYIVYVKQRWWMFWKKPISIHLDPELTTDWNCREIVVEARGFEAVSEGLIYPIPRYGVECLEGGYIQRGINREMRVLKQSVADMDVDADIIPKYSLRGDMSLAHSEVGRFEEMPTMEEETLRKKQKRNVYKNLGDDN